MRSCEFFNVTTTVDHMLVVPWVTVFVFVGDIWKAIWEAVPRDEAVNIHRMSNFWYCSHPGETNCLPLPVWLLEDNFTMIDKLYICGRWSDRLESQSLGCVGAIGMSYRGMKSGTADLQHSLGVKPRWFWRYLLQKSATPCLGCKGGKEKRMK